MTDSDSEAFEPNMCNLARRLTIPLASVFNKARLQGFGTSTNTIGSRRDFGEIHTSHIGEIRRRYLDRCVLIHMRFILLITYNGEPAASKASLQSLTAPSTDKPPSQSYISEQISTRRLGFLEHLRNGSPIACARACCQIERSSLAQHDNSTWNLNLFASP